MASPVTYKVTLPTDYEADRPEPYPMLIIVPAEAGYGGGMGGGGGTTAVTAARFHDDNDAIVLELGFNRPTWLADSSSSNHETFFLEMILPRVLAEHNVGRMSLLGYANGGFGALHALMRHPHLFHRVAVADVPVLGDFNGQMRPWGIEEWGDDGEQLEKPPWWSFADSFPHNAMFVPYSPGALAECEYVAREMGAGGGGSGQGGGGVARIGLWSGSRTKWEMEQLREQFDIFGVAHAWSDEYADEEAGWESGWLKEALDWLGKDL